MCRGMKGIRGMGPRAWEARMCVCACWECGSVPKDEGIRRRERSKSMSWRNPSMMDDPCVVGDRYEGFRRDDDGMGDMRGGPVQ